MIPDDIDAELTVGGRLVRLTNLRKVFWTGSGKSRSLDSARDDNRTKRDLLQYYADVSPYLLPHLHDREMVMKRYPNGATGKCFFMKRVPEPHPDWLETCPIEHKSGGMTPLVKTTGSSGVHIYVGIKRGPTQKQVWTFAKALAVTLASQHPKLLTAEYRIAARPKGHVLVDYNQNAWGRTLASIYSLRPKPRAPVSTPLTWHEMESGVSLDDFRIDNVPGAAEEDRGSLEASTGYAWAIFVGETAVMNLVYESDLPRDRQIRHV